MYHAERYPQCIRDHLSGRRVSALTDLSFSELELDGTVLIHYDTAR